MVTKIHLKWSSQSTHSENTDETESKPHEPEREEPETRQTFIPGKDFKESNARWNSAGGVRVIYARHVKRITLQRVLCSKLAFEKEKFIMKDLLVIFDNMLYLQTMAEKDENFNRKFGSALEALYEILKKTRMTHTPTKVGMNRLSQELRGLTEFLIPYRNLKHTESHFKGKYEVRQGTKLGILKANLPAKRFIGIGPRDKGTARNLALNGEPRWQEYCRMRLWERLT
jgi:hypothetical protein